MIVVGDVLASIQFVLGNPSSPYLYGYLNRAIEVLRSKAASKNIHWDPLLVYLNIYTSQGLYISLPPQVEKPLKVNVNSNPSFARSQTYEFTMNGPGSNDPMPNLQWQDWGQKPYQVLFTNPAQIGFPQNITTPTQPPVGNILTFSCSNSADYAGAGTAIVITVQNLDGSESTQTVTMTGPITLTNPILDLIWAQKPITAGNVLVSCSGIGQVASWLAGVDQPLFNWIRLSQPASFVRILARRRKATVSTATDIIPLESSNALIAMCQSLKYSDELNRQIAVEYETAAWGWLGEEQLARNLFIDAAAATEVAPALNVTFAARDCLIVSDVYDDMCAVWGQIGQQKIFDRMTMVIETVANKSHWEPLIGYIDLMAQGGPDGNQYYLTLPRFIEAPLALNVNYKTGNFRSKWFEFNLSGIGQDLPTYPNWTTRPNGGWEDVGEVYTAFDPLQPNYPILAGFQLVAVASNFQDAGSMVRIYGTDTSGNEVWSSVDGQRGFIVPVIGSGQPIPALDQNAVNFVRFTKVQKDPTIGFVNLWQTDGTNLLQWLAMYNPDDTEPFYQRIRIGQKPLPASLTPGSVAAGSPSTPVVVRMRYRKRWRKIGSLNDQILLRSKYGLIKAAKAMSLGDVGGPTDTTAMLARGQGPQFEMQALTDAIGYFNDEWRSMHPREQLELQIDRETFGPGFDSMM